MTSLAAYAAAIAEPIDQLRIAIAHAARTRLLPLVEEYALPAEALAAAAMLRNLPPDRRATRTDLEQVFLYQPGVLDATLPLLVEGGVVTTGHDVGLTERGVGLMERIIDESYAEVDEQWRAELDYPSLARLVHTVIANAPSTPSLRVIAPVYVRPVTTAKHELSELLTPLRFIRYDAHIAAWQGERLSVDQVQALAEGEQRDRIEVRTNELTGAAFGVLGDGERALLHDAIHALVQSPS